MLLNLTLYNGQRMSSYHIIMAILLWQFCGRGEQETCTNDQDFRQHPAEDSNEIFIQYCSEGSWYYLCIGGVGLTPTLATVACRQLGYSDQGANLSLRSLCQEQTLAIVKSFRTKKACTGTENSLAECGEGVVIDANCPCSGVGVITCQGATPTEDQDNEYTTLAVNNRYQTTAVNSQDSNTTVTSTEIVSSTMTLQEPSASTTIPVLAAVIGVLIALVTVALIVVCLVVVCRRRLTVHQQRNSSPSTRKNESYSLRQLDGPVYDEASSTQPNYSSLGPTYDMEAAGHQLTNSYEHSIDTPQAEPSNPSLPRVEARENDFYDAEQHTYAVVNANKKKKSKKTASCIEGEDNQPEANTQDAPAIPTPVRDEDHKEGDDFYDAEEHTYSAVNVKHKKKACKKSSEDSSGEEWKEN